MASRSTNVTFARSNAIFSVSRSPDESAFCNSGTYSPVNCPHKLTLRVFGLGRTVVIFSTISHSSNPARHVAGHHTPAAELSVGAVYDRPRCYSCRIVGGHKPPRQPEP